MRLRIRKRVWVRVWVKWSGCEDEDEGVDEGKVEWV